MASAAYPQQTLVAAVANWVEDANSQQKYNTKVTGPQLGVLISCWKVCDDILK